MQDYSLGSIVQEAGTLCDAVRRWAASRPDAPALVDEFQPPLTYGQLAAQNSMVGDRLGESGFGRGDRLALVHPGGIRMAATVLGLIERVAVVPLNPSYGLAETTDLFDRRGVTGLVADAGLDTPAREAAQLRRLPVFEVDPVAGGAAGEITLRHDRGPHRARSQISDDRGPVSPDDVIFVMSTSGTTSSGRIVRILHRHIMAGAAHTSGLIGVTETDRCLNLQPLYYSGGLYNLAVALFSGGSVICLPHFSVAKFFGLIGDLAPTWYTGSFTFQQAIHAAAPSYKEAIKQGSLRVIRTSSGALDVEIAQDLEMFFGVPVLSGYSTTETGRIACNPAPPRRRKPGTVGLVTEGNVAILDDAGRPVPHGEIGEIVVRGPQVFDGYENDPATNAASFIDGWFRPGDEGWLDPDGYLTLTGRLKEMINRGGEKVNPSEVDAVLLRHHDLDDVVTFAIPHPTLGEEVAAAVILNKWAAADGQALTRFARKQLAGFKVPRKFIFVEEIPRGPTGKVQRSSLASFYGLENPNTGALGADRAADPPQTELEQRLARIWAKTLGAESVGVNENFFLLGGDSLKAVELFHEIEESLDRRLPESILFEAGTVAEMAALIEIGTSRGPIVPIQPRGDLPPLFCVPGRDANTLILRDLSRLLGERQPLYGVRCEGVDGAGKPFLTMEDMGAHCLSEIRKIQPAGPYYLGGYSFGGRLAFVMAQELENAGENVAVLALFDSYSYAGRKRLTLGERIARNVARIAAMRPGQLFPLFVEKFRTQVSTAGRRTRQWLFRLLREHFSNAGRSVPPFLRRTDDINAAINARYRPRPFNGSAILFAAERSGWVSSEMLDGWHGLVRGGLEVLSVPGGHYDILRPPHVRILASELQARLEKARKIDPRTPGPHPPRVNEDS